MNHRNAASGRTVLTEEGPLRIEVPHDRSDSFEPLLITAVSPFINRLQRALSSPSNLVGFAPKFALANLPSLDGVSSAIFR